MNTERGDPDGSSSDVEETDRACTGLEHPLGERGSAQKWTTPRPFGQGVASVGNDLLSRVAVSSAARTLLLSSGWDQV